MRMATMIGQLFRDPEERKTDMMELKPINGSISTRAKLKILFSLYKNWC